MKTVFDEKIRMELISRINAINENSVAKWGKMNVYQMLKHCALWNEWVLGKNNPEYNQSFLGLIFGKMALRSSVKDDTPMKRNMPAGSAMTIKEQSGDIGILKRKWAELTEEFAHFSNPNFIHDFFGKMTKEEIGIFVYKHTDHHLRQFNV